MINELLDVVFRSAAGPGHEDLGCLDDQSEQTQRVMRWVAEGIARWMEENCCHPRQTAEAACRIGRAEQLFVQITSDTNLGRRLDGNLNAAYDSITRELLLARKAIGDC